MSDSILNIEVSCFANYDTPDNPKTINLLVWLKSSKYRKEIEVIRAIENKDERDKLKALLPGITPSGIFTYRSMKCFKSHSGFVAFDIDLKGNEHVGNYMELKKHICNIKNVAYCGLSASGRGFWGLIPIAFTNKHKQHFRALETQFSRFGIKIDPAPKSIASLRGYSYDPDGYYNHNAIAFTMLYFEPETQIKPYNKINCGLNSIDKIGVAVKMINQAPDGNKHYVLLKASRLIGGYISSGEVDENSAISALESAIQQRDISSFTKAKITIQKGIDFGKKTPIEVSSNAPTPSKENQMTPIQKLIRKNPTLLKLIQTFDLNC